MATARARIFNRSLASSFSRTVPRTRILGQQSPFTARLRQQHQPWQSQTRTYAYGRYNYQRFQSTTGLLKRWAARPTFYYEVGGIGVACGGFYAWNLEEVPVRARTQQRRIHIN